MARETAEMDLEVYLTKAATDLQERFADWLKDTVGYDPSKAKTKDEAFNEGVRLATALRMAFQRSDENQEVLNARREERETDAPEDKPAKKAASKAVTSDGKAKVNSKMSKKAVAPVADEESEEPPAKTAKRTTKKAAAAPATPARNKRRVSAPVEDDGESAPF